MSKKEKKKAKERTNNNDTGVHEDLLHGDKKEWKPEKEGKASKNK